MVRPSLNSLRLFLQLSNQKFIGCTHPVSLVHTVDRRWCFRTDARAKDMTYLDGIIRSTRSVFFSTCSRLTLPSP